MPSDGAKFSMPTILPFGCFLTTKNIRRKSKKNILNNELLNYKKYLLRHKTE